MKPCLKLALLTLLPILIFPPGLCARKRFRAPPHRETRYIVECDPVIIDDGPVYQDKVAPRDTDMDMIRRPYPPPPRRSCTKTLIVVILDESGSMAVQKSDVIGGYNSFINNQRDVTNDQARLILIKFNTVVDVAHGAMDLSQVPHLNYQSYQPGGGTALYDAVSEGILIAEGAAKPDERILVLIMTDGEENSSKKATSSAVKAMIQRKEALGTWTFAYIGANPEAWATRMGQTRYNVREYDLQDQGANMEKASDAVAKFRGAAAPQSKAFFKQ